MKILNFKNIILIIVLFMSIFIFQLGNNAMLLPRIEKKTENSYLIKVNNEENPTIGKVIERIGKLKYRRLDFSYEEYAYEVSKFTKKFIEEVKISFTDKDSINKKENTAVVNKKYKEMVFQKKGKEYINCRGHEYRVIGYYADNRDSTIEEKLFYINICSSSIANDNHYNLIEIQGNGSLKESSLKRILKKELGSFEIRKSNDGYIDTREVFVFELFLCALLVIFNCVGFIQKWINYQKREISIRLLVGATKEKIIKLYFTRFFMIICISFLFGTIISTTIMDSIRKTQVLNATRNLFGTSLLPASILLSFVEILLIGYLLLGINILLQVRRGNISGKIGRY